MLHILFGQKTLFFPRLSPFALYGYIRHCCGDVGHEVCPLPLQPGFNGVEGWHGC